MPNLLDGLFPRNSAYDGLLAIDQIRALQNQSLMRAGIGTMGAAAQGAPLGQALSAGAGPVMAEWPEQMERTGLGAMRMSAFQEERAKKERRRALAAKYPAPPNETSAQARMRLLAIRDEAATVDPEFAAEIQALLPSLQQVDTGDRKLLTEPTSGATIRDLPTTDPAAAGNASDDLRALYQQYLGQTTREAAIADNYRALVGHAEDPSPAGDIGVIFAYMKMLDPTSTVRESEYATAENTGSIPQRVWQQYNKALSGTKLTDDQRADFVNQARKRARGSHANVVRLRKSFERRGQRYGGTIDDVSYDHFEGLPISIEGIIK